MKPLDGASANEGTRNERAAAECFQASLIGTEPGDLRRWTIAAPADRLHT
jgi:hypothetical protein